MSVIRFFCPPLPHYIVSGEDTYPRDRYHLSRSKLGVFDILIVTEGGLFMTEEAASWELYAGEFLLLRPDAYHRPTSATKEKTHFYYLHVHTSGNWEEISQGHEDHSGAYEDAAGDIWGTQESTYLFQRNKISTKERHIEPQSVPFILDIPKYGKLMAPNDCYEKIKQLIELEKKSQTSARFRQQVIFQSILYDLQNSQYSPKQTSANTLAEDVASYLRVNYDKEIKYADIEKVFRYNATYIARCMVKTFGISTNEYLVNYRIEKAKFLLANSDYFINEIAQQVGFLRLSYFTKCFTNKVGVRPKDYRKKYRI